MKKLLALVLGICLTFTCVACGGGGGGNNDGKLEITAIINQSGIGTAWLENAAARYEEVAKDKQFGDYVGVTIEIDATVSPESELSSSSGYDIVTSSSNIFDNIQQGLLMDLTELFTRESVYDSTPIIDRVSEDVKTYYTNIDGKYYGLPHYQYQSIVTYNREVFDDNLFYFAADSANGTPAPTKYGTALFVNNLESTKSNGPDCKPNTFDDGLPSTLEELIILCQVMKEAGVEPFHVSGQYTNYANSLNSALCASLAGYDQLQAFWELNGDEVEVINETFGVGESGPLAYSNENLFEGINYIKKPASTSKVALTMENGFRAGDMTAKYYSGAFLEILEKEEFFSSDSYIDTISHTGAQESFLLGNKNGGMSKGIFIDGSYWYNETIYAGTNDVLDMLGYDIKDLDVRPMPLPMYATNAMRDADQANWENKINIVPGAALSAIVVQKKVEEDPVKREAIFDFLDFLYSTEECEMFTQETSLIRGMDYDVDYNELETTKGKYSVALFDYLRNSKIVNQISTNKFMKINRGSFKMEIFQGDTWWVGSHGDCYLDGIRAGHNTVSLIEGTRIKSSQWVSLLEAYRSYGFDD